MDKQISYVYSRALTKRAAKQVWLQYYGRFYVFWIGALSFSLVLLLIFSDVRQLSYAEVFGFGALVGALCVFIVQLISSYANIERGIVSASRKLNNTELVYKFNAQGISTESVAGSAHRFWGAFNRLWVKPDVWFLFNSDGTYLILPTYLLSADLQQFIMEKITESGGKVER